MAEKLGVSISVKSGEASGLSDMQKSSTSRRSAIPKDAPKAPTVEALSVNIGQSMEETGQTQELQYAEASGNTGLHRPLFNDSVDQTVIAPGTPVAQFGCSVNFPESPDSSAYMKFKEKRCLSFEESVEEPSQTGDKELDISLTDEVWCITYV